MLFRQYLEMWCEKSRLLPDDWGKLAQTFGDILRVHSFPDNYPDHDFNQWMETFHFEGLHGLFEGGLIGYHTTPEQWEKYKAKYWLV